MRQYWWLSILANRLSMGTKIVLFDHTLAVQTKLADEKPFTLATFPPIIASCL